MASSKEYLNFILEQLDDLENIKYRAMMGEYILYYNDKIGLYNKSGAWKNMLRILILYTKRQISYKI